MRASRLAVPLALLAGLSALFGVDRLVAHNPPFRGQLVESIESFQPDASHKQAVILGTCLSEQHILLPDLQQAMPTGWQVHNIGAPSTTPVEWYLALKNRLAEAPIGALVIAFGRFDLTEPGNPWESETLDLATSRDLEDLLDRVCETSECRLDLRLRKASALWRYRPLLGAMIWQRLGMASATPDQSRARLRVVDGLRDQSAEVWDPNSPSVLYLRRLVDLARERGAQVYFLPLPLRPDQPDRHQLAARAALQNGLQTLVQQTGSTLLAPPPLPPDVFQDEVHLHGRGAMLFTGWLSNTLPPLLGPARPH